MSFPAMDLSAKAARSGCWIGYGAGRAVSIMLGLAWFCLGAILAFAGEEKLSGQSAAGSSAKAGPQELRFIRVYAPADRVREWPWGDMKYVPVEGAEFERLIRFGEESVSGPLGQPWISSVTCRAALAEPTWLEGETTFTIQTSREQTAVLRWTRWPLAIRTANWLDPQGKPQEPALLGLNESGQMELVVPRSGQMRLEWSLQGQQDEGGLRFALALPACPHTELRLDLPEQLRPVLPGALIRLQEPPPATGRKSWLLEWGGSLREPLRLVPQTAEAGSARMLVQQQTQYTLLPEGLEALVRFAILPLAEPISELSFLVDAGLEVQAVQRGSQALAWRWEPSGASGPRRLWVLLPQPLVKEPVVFQVGLVGPVVLEAPWQLPRVRLEGAIWQQGGTVVRIGSGLQLQRIVPNNCRLSKTESVPSEPGPAGELFEFQAYSADAGLELLLGRREPTPLLAMGTLVRFSERQMNARVRARVWAEAGEHFLLQAQVGRRWLIDAVEADPAAQVEDWTLDSSSQRLTIRLARPVTPQRQVGLQIVARRLQSPVGRSWRTEELAPVRFTGVQELAHLVALTPPEGSYELICLTPEPNLLLNPRQGEVKYWDLVDKVSDGFLFLAAPQTQSLQWMLRPRMAQYRAKIHVDVAASARSVSERYRVECLPEGSPVERVVIVFSHSRPEPVQWMLSGDSQRPWSARRLTDKDLLPEQFPLGGEAWEIQLRPARSEPFVLVGQRSTAFAGQMPVALVGLPQAAHQQATVRVQTVGPQSPQIVSSRILPIPSAGEDVLPSWTVQLASFRYDPKTELSGNQRPALLLQSAKDLPIGRQTWAWQARLESWVQPNGLSKHLAIYSLVNFLPNPLHLRIPSEASGQIEGVWLNGQSARWQLQKSDGEGDGWRLEVALPPDRTVCRLVIALQTHQPPLRTGSKLRPCLPVPEVPVASGSWTVWLPPGWQARCPTEYTLRGQESGLSVAQRLFGVWARASYRRPFDPFSLEDWRSLFGKDTNVQQSRLQADAFFQALGALLRRPTNRSMPADSPAASSPGQRWTWAELLQHQSVSQVGKILVDRQGLWELGIDPDSPVWVSSLPGQEAAHREESDGRLGRQAFWQARLALGLYQGMILVTSWERASSWPGWVQQLGDPLVWTVSPQTEDPLRNLSNPIAEPLFVPPDSWQESAEPSGGGDLQLIEWPSDAAGLGWTAYTMELPESAQGDRLLEIEVFDQAEAQTWYWVGFLVAGGLTLVVTKRRWVLAAAGAAVLATAALAAPDSWVPPASGAFGGSLLGLLIGAIPCIRTPTAQQASPTDSDSASSRAGTSLGSSSGRVITVGILLWGVLLGMQGVMAAEPSPATAPPTGSSPLYRVFIPIDDKQQPTGDPYQVPELLYQYLRRRVQTRVPSASSWRLRQAVYRAELTRSPITGRWEIPRLSVTWQCDLEGKVAQVSLPLTWQQFPIVPQSWQVEGQPIEPQWNEAGTMLILPIPVPASSVRIEGQVWPVLWDQAAWQRMELAIPPSPQARLELGLPPDAPEVHLEGALGMVKRTGELRPRLIAELGPVERLSLRWPAGAPPSETALPLIDQLLWLRVQPGAVLLDARFRVSGGQAASGRPMVLRLMGENRLRLIWHESSGAEGNPKLSPFAGGQIFEFPIRLLATDQPAVLAVRFLLTDTPGVGNIRLPKLEPLEVRMGRRWLAVSVDPSLEYPTPPPNVREPVPVGDFLELWGPADTTAQFVDTLAAGQAWTLMCRPRIPNSSVEQTVWLGYGEKAVRLCYEASLSTTSGPSFHHCLHAPPDLQIETISILQANTPAPIRWTRTPGGKITVFSSKPLTGRYELQLTGVCPTQLSQRRSIPYVELEGAETEWATLVLLRQPEVLLRLVKSDGLMEIDPPAGLEAKSPLGRLFKAFAVDPRQIAEAELQVLPNRPQTTCQQMILIRPEPDQWRAEVDLHLQVQKGLLDEIVLEVPPSWPGPYKTTPQVALSTKELAEGRRAIVLRPPTPIEQTYRIRIAGPIHWPKTGPQEVPVIRPVQLPVTEHLLVLPTQEQLRPLVWETQGMQKIALPEALRPELEDPGAWDAYRATSAPWTARLQPMAEQSQQPEVRLADIQLRWESDGACSGKAWFYILPGGQDRCVVCLPTGFRLLHVQVDNNPSAPIFLEQSQRYTVLLTSSELPQVVEVSFLGMLPDGVLEGLQPFPAPWIEHWPVAASLWTIYCPAGYELVQPEGLARISPLRLDEHRLRTISSLLEIGCRQMPEPKEHFLRWYEVWRERFSAISREVQRHLALPPATQLHHSLRAEAQALQLKLAQLAESLGLAESLPDTAPKRLSGLDPAKQWFQWLKGRGTVTRAVLDASSQSLLLTYRPKKTSPILFRWLLAGAIAGAGFLLVCSAAKLLPSWWLTQWRPLLGLLAGLIWWLWLWPSALGWVFILLALGASFRKGFPSARSPAAHRRL